jgi:hypothetical protein
MVATFAIVKLIGAIGGGPLCYTRKLDFNEITPA